MAAAVDTANVYSEALDQEDAVFPCKGCGEVSAFHDGVATVEIDPKQILEEGKAFELGTSNLAQPATMSANNALLAGNRWHIDCFRCNTCQTLLDSDANLLLLGDGSLICNNCTYSCSACGNKIEDLAILTGNEAFCASCFKCRNCKRKIDNLRYARTSQGIFCMTCHESLMQRRRARAGRGKTSSSKRDAAGSGSYEKRLPELPAKPLASQSAFSPDDSSPASSQAGSAAAKQNDYMSYKHASPSSNYDNSKGEPSTPSPSPSRHHRLSSVFQLCPLLRDAVAAVQTAQSVPFGGTLGISLTQRQKISFSRQALTLPSPAMFLDPPPFRKSRHKPKTS